MSSMVLFDRYEITPMSKAKMLAEAFAKAVEIITADLDSLLLEREEEIGALSEKLEIYEPKLKPRKFT